MTQNTQHKDADRASPHSKSNRLAHWARVGMMFISGGFIFPHAMSEDDDAKRDANRNAKNTT